MADLLLRAAIQIAAALAAIGLVIAAIGFLVAALYAFLVSLPVTPALAALIVALALIGFAGLVMTAMWIAFGRAKTAGGRKLTAAQLCSLAARETAAAIEAHPYRASSAAFLVGLALGGSPDVRALVTAVLRAAGRGGDTA